MERIHVSVRARPLSAEEAKSSPWRMSGNGIYIPNQPTKFEFDRIFGEDCKTRDVYTARTRDIVAASVRGFNGTVFAYGQTSSGKTHTMRGSNSEPGVIPLAVHDLFNIIHEELDREFLLRMSYLEIYNEEINDLLAPEHRKLQIHESVERGIFVAGLREEIVASPDQVLELMKFGEAHRHIGETNMNVYSSRSHTIFRMIIESREKSDDGEADITCDAVRVSVLNLVDLAGSERAAKTGAEGVRLKEGSYINKSLSSLGTVINKLSEGERGHVPYRDSKLTRILQPALGGNANTAIICNITLAQVHADETKSSLQFASRALRVTNCAHVNEILTDAALLKRQKKEIEELRAKLQGSKSEHLEEEILNLRNTLLKSELERERIALELEEEKRAQAEKEKRLLEQAKKIENLSSMVFCANRDETSELYKKEKRRDTWCPGKVARKTMKEPPSVVKENVSEMKSRRADCGMRLLLPFNELINESSATVFCTHDEDCKRRALEECTLPDPHALLHVTSRRKAPLRKRSLPMDNDNLAEIQAEFENLLMEFETHRTMSDIQIDYLTRKLAEADDVLNEKCRESAGHNIDSIAYPNGVRSLRAADAILMIQQLQEKIATLEMERSSSQYNLDNVVDLATEQTIFVQEKCEKLYEELALAQEEAAHARDALASSWTSVGDFDWLNSLLTETQEIKLEFENSKVLIGSLTSVLDELINFSYLMPIHDLRDSYSQSLVQVKSIAGSQEKIQLCLTEKVNKLEDEKHALHGQVSELHSRIKDLSLEIQNSANALMELNEKHEGEMAELQCQLQMLQKEILSLSSCSLAKERECLRKDFEKTKLKLKDTESKLKNVMQEKTKLEGEKSSAERELKRLQGQKAMLERDMSKQSSIIGKRRDSTIDRSSNVFDSKRVKCSPALVELEDEYKKLEVLAFEMEATIGSLEEQLSVVSGEKDLAISKVESLAAEVQTLSDELHISNTELNTLQEEVSVLRTTLEESNIRAREMENSLKFLSEEKEDLSMQLAEALMTIEEEKAIWSSKEKASMEIIGEKEKQYNAEIASLSTKLSEARSELQICRQNVKDLEESLKRLEENGSPEQQCGCRKENVPEANQVTGQRAIDSMSNGSPEVPNQQIGSECEKTNEDIEMLRLELSVLRKERQYLLAQVQKLEQTQIISKDDSQVSKLKHELEQQRQRLASIEDKMHNDQITISKERAKLRMRLRGAQTKLDTFRVRYQESVDENNYMNRKFEEASAKLKKQLASYGSQVLDLRKQLAACKRE